MVKFAISGKANSGKNTAATLLGEQYIAYNSEPRMTEFKVLGFADPMKKMIMKMYPGTNPDILWGASELRMTPIPNTSMSYRQLLMDIGKLGRSYNPNVWIDATISMANQYAAKGNIPIIADCRFKNELKSLKEEEFFLIRIVRPGNLYQELTTSQDISEIDLDDVLDSAFDAIIINDGSISELRHKIAQMVLAMY
jgi:hypothetical protein